MIEKLWNPKGAIPLWAIVGLFVMAVVGLATTLYALSFGTAVFEYGWFIATEMVVGGVGGLLLGLFSLIVGIRAVVTRRDRKLRGLHPKTGKPMEGTAATV